MGSGTIDGAASPAHPGQPSSDVRQPLTHRCHHSILNRPAITRSFPVSLTLLHMIASICMTRAVVCVTNRNIRSGEGQHAEIVLLACLFTLSVALGNMSLRHVPVSTNQIVSSTTPIFTALLSAAFLGRYQSKQQYLSLLPMATGVAISCRSSVASGGAVSDGVVFCLLATLLRAVKSVVQESILNKGRSMDSLSLLYHMAPVSACLLMTLMPYEADLSSVSSILWQNPPLAYGLALNALLAVIVNLCNLLVTQFSSAVTLQVHGNVKIALASLISFVLMEGPADATTLLGALIALTGLGTYARG